MHGNLKEEYFNFVFQPYLEADQTISGITIIGNEVTEGNCKSKDSRKAKNSFKQLLPQERHFMDQQCKEKWSS
jgi:hypothetical protein